MEQMEDNVDGAVTVSLGSICFNHSKKHFLSYSPCGLADQKLCYIQIYEIFEKKTENVLENGW